MTYSLTFEAKDQILKDHNIKYYKTKNSLFIGRNNITNFSDSTFVSLICAYINI